MQCILLINHFHSNHNYSSSHPAFHSPSFSASIAFSLVIRFSPEILQANFPSSRTMDSAVPFGTEPFLTCFPHLCSHPFCSGPHFPLNQPLHSTDHPSHFPPATKGVHKVFSWSIPIIVLHSTLPTSPPIPFYSHRMKNTLFHLLLPHKTGTQSFQMKQSFTCISSHLVVCIRCSRSSLLSHVKIKHKWVNALRSTCNEFAGTSLNF